MFYPKTRHTFEVTSYGLHEIPKYKKKEKKMPHLYNRTKDKIPEGAVYIGRGSPWGNPFVIGRDGSRNEVCMKFEDWIMKPAQTNLRFRAIQVLRGRDLVCFCSPLRCHGLTWLEIANKPKEK